MPFGDPTYICPVNPCPSGCLNKGKEGCRKPSKLPPSLETE